mgnify:CR=1 FL=1
MFDETEGKLRELIAEGLKVDKELIKRSSKLEDWGGDSLDFIETLFIIETHFDISLSELNIDQDTDFEKIVKLVKQQIKPKA